MEVERERKENPRLGSVENRTSRERENHSLQRVKLCQASVVCEYFCLLIRGSAVAEGR